MSCSSENKLLSELQSEMPTSNSSRETTPFEEGQCASEFSKEFGFFCDNSNVEVTNDIMHLYKKKPRLKKEQRVAGPTLRLQSQEETTEQQNCILGAMNSHHINTKPSQTSVNCMQQPSTPTTSSLNDQQLSSTSPIAAKYMGSSSLISLETGVVLSGSSGCGSLSNSPSSSSSNSYLKSHSMENSCNRLTATAENQMCSNISSNDLNDSITSVTSKLNASLLAVVNGDLEDDRASPEISNQTETNIHMAESINQTQHDNSENENRLMMESIHHQHTQQLCTDSPCLNNEDARTLQIAVELTMMNLNQIPSTSTGTLPLSSITNNYQQLQPHHMLHGSINYHQQPHSSSSPVANQYNITTKSFLHSPSGGGAALLNHKFFVEQSQENISNSINSMPNPNQSMSAAAQTAIIDERSKKSQNMTECVPVPSSEHVAEIVGRQGCKIKALRAKTNTYIKTPVRNEEPVFVVTGRKEDVAKAKREILSAAEHFTLIRATRRTSDAQNGCLSNSQSGTEIGGSLVPLNKNVLTSTTTVPGQITIQVRVPYRVVGLVVGPKGNTIKHIQHETQTYIITPSRDKEPIFEVTGMPDNVQLARKQIEAHIAARTGNSLAVPSTAPSAQPCSINSLTETIASNPDAAFHSLNSLSEILNDNLHSEILSSIYKNGIGSALEYSKIGGGGNLLNSGNKCNTTNTFNDLVKTELNPNIISINDIQRRVTMNSDTNITGNIKLNCSEFIDNIMESSNSNATQHLQNIDKSKQFSQVNSASAIRNIKSVINSINLLENSNNGLLQQQANLTANTLLTRSCSSASSTASSSKSSNNTSNNSNNQFWKSLVTNGTCATTGCNDVDNIEIDEGIGESPLYSWGLPNSIATLTNAYCTPTSASISPTDSLFGDGINNKRAIMQHQLEVSSKTKMLEKLKRKNCWMCHEKDIVAALIPCGHTILCSVCANRL